MHVQLIVSHQDQLFHMETESSVKEVTENNLLQYVLLCVRVIIFRILLPGNLCENKR